MALGLNIGGYLTALKRKNRKDYQKWLDTVQGAGKSATQRQEELMRADLKYGIVDLGELGSKTAQERKEAKTLNENVSIAGAINRLVETMAVQSVNQLQVQQSQLQQFGLDPMRAELERLQGLRADNQTAIDQQQQLYEEAVANKKAQERLLNETADRLSEAQAEYANLQAKLQAAKVAEYGIPKDIHYDVPVRTENYAALPPKRDAKGKFLPRGQGGAPEAAGEAQG